MQILYEDNHLIAVWKPAGMLTQSAEAGDVSLLEEVRKFLKEKYQKPGNVFVGLLHRLDRPVEGIVLFAKTSKGASRLSEQIRNGELKKIYHALVEGVPEKPAGALENMLAWDEEKRYAHITDSPTAGAKRASLSYKTLPHHLDVRFPSALLEIEIHTGRHHQIRAQLAHLGHPIVGDAKYGARTNFKKGTIALAAVSLTFKTATGDQMITLQQAASFEEK